MPLNVSVIDNFNRAGPALGANWTTDPYADGAGSPGILSNQWEASSFDFAYWNANTYSTASGILEVAVTLIAFPANTGSFFFGFGQGGIGTSSADGYQLEITYSSGGADSWDIVRVDNSSTTSIANGTFTLALNDILILRRQTNGDWQAVKDTGGTESALGSVNSTTYTGAFNPTLGAFDSAGTIRLDDFAAGTFTTGTDATVTAVPADATGDSPDSVITGSADTNQVSPVADGTGDCPIPAVTAGAVVAAVPATGLGIAPLAGNEVSAEVGAPPALAVEAITAPAVTGSGGADVIAVPADAASGALTHVLTADALVVSVVADAAGTLPVPVVTGELGALVTAVTADCIGYVPAPVVSDGTESPTVVLWEPTVPEIPEIPVLAD